MYVWRRSFSVEIASGRADRIGVGGSQAYQRLRIRRGVDLEKFEIEFGESDGSRTSSPLSQTGSNQFLGGNKIC